MRKLILLLVAVLTCISLFSSYGNAGLLPDASGPCTGDGQTKSCPQIRSHTTLNGQVIQPAMAAPCTCQPNGVGFTWSQCEYPGNGGWTEWKGSCVEGTYMTRDCVFKAQTTGCGDGTIDPLYECGAWVNGECTKECTPGQVINTYTANMSGCDYTTSTKTCCANGFWNTSAIGHTCTGAMNCNGTTSCWNGSTCVSNIETVACTKAHPSDSHITGGTTSRQKSNCLIGSGWQESGAWDKGSCTCENSYAWGHSGSSNEWVCYFSCNADHSTAAEKCRSCAAPTEWSSGSSPNSCGCKCTASGYTWQSAGKGACVKKGAHGAILERIDCETGVSLELEREI